MTKDIETKVYELTIERQIQDRVITQLRTECNELKLQIAKSQQHKSLSVENRHNGIQTMQGKLNRMMNKKNRFNDSKDKLMEAILAILQNLRLECESLKVALVESVRQVADDSLLIVVQNMRRSSNVEDQDHTTQSNEQLDLIKKRYQDHINSFQQKVDKLTHQLQGSEKNEINLIALNKKQLMQIDDLKFKLRKRDNTEDRTKPTQMMSKTSTDWRTEYPKEEPKDSSFNKSGQDIFAATLPLGWSNRFDQSEMFKLKRSQEQLDKQFTSVKNEIMPSKSQQELARYTSSSNDSSYYGKLTSKYLKKGQ